jgi:protein-tyrosine phosphatase
MGLYDDYEAEDKEYEDWLMKNYGVTANKGVTTNFTNKPSAPKKEYSNYIKFKNAGTVYLNDAPWDAAEAIERSLDYQKKGVTTVVVLLEHGEMVSMYNTPKAPFNKFNPKSVVDISKIERKVNLIDVYKNSGLKVLHYPILDFQTPPSMQSFDQLQNKLVQVLNKKESILIHCYAGRGRTGVVIAGLLVKCGMTAVDAIARAREARDVLDTKEQIQFIKYYESYLHQVKKNKTK